MEIDCNLKTLAQIIAKTLMVVSFACGKITLGVIGAFRVRGKVHSLNFDKVLTQRLKNR